MQLTEPSEKQKTAVQMNVLSVEQQAGNFLDGALY